MMTLGKSEGDDELGHSRRLLDGEESSMELTSASPQPGSSGRNSPASPTGTPRSPGSPGSPGSSRGDGNRLSEGDLREASMGQEDEVVDVEGVFKAALIKPSHRAC